ncbi:putative transport protein [Halococcus morrhuae DSM 1307]|uniref:Putative transport protein n=2 Tax=Halococcus morrhuae TaxID=2250 RepID=M0MFU1_HALMO|nr:putative transport protein [Halococcus morrhuae DSM 1307]
MTTGMLVVFAVVFAAFVLFITGYVRPDVTALLVLVALVVLNPWTNVSPAQALAGFSNEATITVLAMLILSDGVRRTGVIRRLAAWVSDRVGTSESKQRGAIVAIAGSSAGFVNDTPVVALLVPLVTDLARRGNTSPSKLLIPLSYAAMMGGTLTLIGTSTNLLASGLAENLLGQSLTMFQFTPVGLVVLVTGALYLYFVAPRLLPERIDPDENAAEANRIEGLITEVDVDDASPLVDRTPTDAFDDVEGDVEVLGIVRNRQSQTPEMIERIQAGDALIIRADSDTVAAVDDRFGLLSGKSADEIDEVDADDDQSVVEVVVPSGSAFAGETPTSARLAQRYDTALLAVRRGNSVIRKRLRDVELAVGDVLVLRTPEENVERLSNSRELVFVSEGGEESYREEKIPVALGILVGVVGLAGLGLLAIEIAALAGVVAMVLTGVLRPSELYEGVEWDVIFLLAGVIPLGIAMSNTGAANFIGALVAQSADFLPVIVVLGLFYVLTVILTNIISNNASVALMVPVGISAARSIGANPLAFVLIVMFAGSAAFLSPVGYQTNLFVYGPGGYEFTDYARVGAPLQVILTVVTTLGVALYFGV